MSKNNYKVYVHINKINGKRYYGITKLEVKTRWNSGYGYQCNEYFNRAINKYGWNEGFEHIVIARGLTEEEAKWLEIELIREHDTTNPKYGYNITLGGEGGNGKKHTEETKKKISEASKGRNTTKVYCVELDMYFNSITEAGEYVGCCSGSSISAVLTGNGRHKTCGGYHWLYAEEVNEENINKVMSEEYNKHIDNGKSIKVYCIELEQYFDTVSEASKFVGCTISNISAVLKGKNKIAKGYHWLRAEEVNEENINKVMSTRIYCVELDMYFNTVREASKFVGCNESNISDVLSPNKSNKTAKGFHWLYAKDVNEENINKVLSEKYNTNKGNATKVYCVELDMYFDTVKEASEYIGCSSVNISAVLKGKNKIAKGYHWLYAEDVNEENINRVMSQEKNILKGKDSPSSIKVYCVELDMYFDTITEASKYVGCHISSISMVLNPNYKNKTAKGYHWLYAEDVEIENSKVS